MYPPLPTVRHVTPFNRLVGGVIVSQTRKAPAPCAALQHAVGKGFVDEQTLCLSDKLAGEPFGSDPVLMSTSSIYNGKVTFGSAYRAAEKGPSKFFEVPLGFFNHSYDAIRGLLKPPALIRSDRAAQFLVFLDERATWSHASDMIAYLREGGFIDGQTEAVSVEFVTYNNNGNVFAHVTVSFTWDRGGGIAWDYSMRTAPGPPIYSAATSPLQMPLEVESLEL